MEEEAKAPTARVVKATTSLVTTKNGTTTTLYDVQAGGPEKKVTRKFKDFTDLHATLQKVFAAPFEQPDGTFGPLQLPPLPGKLPKFPTVGELEDRFDDLDKLLVGLQKVERVRTCAAMRK